MSRINRIGLVKERHSIPDLLVIQVESFKEFLQEDIPPSLRKNEGLENVFKSTLPVEDIHGKYKLEFVNYRIGASKYTPEECKTKNLTYSVPLWTTLRLIRRDEETKEFQDAIDQEVYLADIPYMTKGGTFVINGIERVVVNQLHRSPGVYYELEARGLPAYRALLVPYRGPWIEFNIDGSETIGITISKRRRLPITRLLRALGYVKSSQILRCLFEPVKLRLENLSQGGEYILLDDLYKQESGELILESLSKLDTEAVKLLGNHKIKEVDLLDTRDPRVEVIINTIRQDRIKDEHGALGNIYRTLRYTPPKDDDEARLYIESFFFAPQRFYLGRVGRYKLNFRLGYEDKNQLEALTREDLIRIIKHLLSFYIGEERADDVNDLANRHVRRVGELLYEQFRIAFLRLARVIRERMLLERGTGLSPKRLVNPRLVTSSLLTFFTGDRLSQFLDQTNPLAELTHKRRLSALGKGGLTRETAGFEVRDVHPSHYGRLCPIETPEGQNIGLIASLTTYAKIDPLGFVTTPLIKVKNGRISKEIVELTPHEEEGYKIASADIKIDFTTNQIMEDRVWVRFKGGYPAVQANEVDFIDVSPRQLVSPAAALIPFLEHNDANRALMGCNMQRQAVPLLQPEIPLVGTGMEQKVAADSGALVLAKREGRVVEVDAAHIVIEPQKTDAKKFTLKETLDSYLLDKFKRSNQNTAINQRPVVELGNEVKEGNLLSDGPATSRGELALGHNLLVALLPWYGYNFEDAIVVSERILRDDIFTSVHILEFEVEVRETKLGPEEVTRDLPSVGEDALKALDEHGVVGIGSEVKPDDILVGKISPKGERELAPEERLIYAIFSEKAKDVRDTSKRVPPGVQGTVVDVIVLSKRRDDPLSLKIAKEKKRQQEERAHLAITSLNKRFREATLELMKNEKLQKGIKDDNGKIVKSKGAIVEEAFLIKHSPLKLNFPAGCMANKKKEAKLRTLLQEAQEIEKGIKEKLKAELQEIERGDELPTGVLQLIKVYVAQKRKLQVGDKLAGRHGNKGVVAKIAPLEDMPFSPDGTPVDVVLNPLGIPSRMNVGQILEIILGWAAKKQGTFYATPNFTSMSLVEIQQELRRAGLPPNGKVRLRDGKSGEALDSETTIGYAYLFKLVHMVEDKVHARATGPYSLITQQPVGGKSHFGGQRFGEMEVWALQAYGASFTLQEMLTVKSDDIRGRNQLYQSIIKGEEPPEPGLPASFDVLLKELRGLALDIDIETK